MVLHVTARKLICADIEVAIVTSQIIFHSHTISVYWAIPFNIGTPPIEGSGYPRGGRGFLPQNFLEGSLRNFQKNSKN